MAKYPDFDHAKYLSKAALEYGRQETARINEWLANMPFMRPDVSPVETMFGIALAVNMDNMLDCWAEIEESSFSNRSNEAFEDLVLPPCQGLFAFYQTKVGPYRVDFMFAIRSLERGTSFFAFEIDGHQFHEKTKEQASKDKARDRYLQSRGISVFRFTGSEVWGDPDGCVLAAIENCQSALTARHGGK